MQAKPQVRLLDFFVPARDQADCKIKSTNQPIRTAWRQTTSALTPDAKPSADDERDGKADPEAVDAEADVECEDEAGGDADDVVPEQIEQGPERLLALGAEDAARDDTEAVEDLEERDERHHARC
jgi:hypothetical protein